MPFTGQQMLCANIIIICSDIIELGAMVSALSGDHNVVAFHDIKEARFYTAQPFQHDIAFVEFGANASISVSDLLELEKNDINVVVLFRTPCPQPVVDLFISGKIYGLLRLPIDLELFILQAQRLIAQASKRKESLEHLRRILTPKEVAYILGEDNEGKS
jgi:hypothetical protein